MACISSLIDSIIALIGSLFSTSSSSSSSSSSLSLSSSSSSSSSSLSPSSSSSSIPYDVFLSFRGKDTRYNFTDHLYRALGNRGIRTFRDDTLNRGEEIASELFKVIERSKFSIVVFSEHYADSKWCLNELVKIMECREKKGQIVLSIFYRVDPSDVRKQTGSFGKAFNNYKKEKKEMVQRWRTALTQAANLSGWHLWDGYESNHIEKIVGDIFSRLDRHPFIHVDKNVGLDSQLQDLTLRLYMESIDVRMIGIYGCGGIGKTTLAKVICNRIFHLYEGTVFLANVREVTAGPADLVKLQEQLLNIVVTENHNVYNVDQGKIMIRNMLCLKKVLIIIDDVEDQSQLESLVGSKEWFGPGSRIIITTRNEDLLKVHHPVDESYCMKELDVEDAIKLFSWNAFREDRPKQEYLNLSNCIVRYTKGLPLALKVFGSLLYGKNIHEWESEFEKLRSVPNLKIQNVLKISYEGLDRLQKEIFLDIACFFKGRRRYDVSRILDGCNFYATSGIRVLCDRSLITIFNDYIDMHDLIQQMGWEIVCEQFPGDPNKWSRLWKSEDIYRAFTRKQKMANVEAIFMDLSRLKGIQFNSEDWAEMTKLRLLQIIISDYEGYMKKASKVHVPEDFEFPSYELSYLRWDRCPLKSLSSNFDGENLVEIRFWHSNIRQPWPGNKCLGKLKILDFNGSKLLRQISDFSTMPILEDLDLTLCESLEEIDSSIGVLKKLTQLKLSGCKQLRSLPSSIQYLDSLEYLSLGGCLKLEKFPEMETGYLKGLIRLSLSDSGIKELPSSIGYLTALKNLFLDGCKKLTSVPTNICKLKSLENFDLSGCSSLEKFPEIMEDMPGVLFFFLSGTGMKELPSAVLRMNHLICLYFGNRKHHVTLPSTIYNLEFLRWLWFCGGAMFAMLPRNLEELIIKHCTLLEEIPELPSTLELISACDCQGSEAFLKPSTPLSSFLKLLKAATKEPKSSTYNNLRIGVSIPGCNRIPLWVSSREMGNHIRIELPMNLWLDNNFLGFAFFLVNYKEDRSKTYGYSWNRWTLLGDSGVKKDFVARFETRCECLGRNCSASDQLLIEYYPKTALLTNYHSNQCRWLEIFVPCYDINREPLIKSCGLHLVYMQDLLRDFGDNGLDAADVDTSGDDAEQSQA